ncbi:MAG: ABC transporter ATP-binding protein [Anaerolineales bacterium]|nr:ABC transporter ATP-binding protein [Anaerolineales bacterium]MCB9126688.1 ABC transporter ATP-binding protein [Ardenticatenales bacterium]MCB9171770.1 ABC transporter ATP-binding protein [Ardenticatenales bacterium]
MQTYKRLLSYILPYKGRYTLAMALVVLSVLCELLTPWLFGRAVDLGVAGGDMQLVLLYSGLLIVAQLVRSGFHYMQWIVQHQAGQNIVRDIRDQLYDKLQLLSQSFYRDMPTGQIMSRMTSDVESVQEYMGWGLLIQFAAITSFVGTAIALFFVDGPLTSVLLLPLLPLAVVVYFFDKHIGAMWKAIRDQMGQLTTVLQENISGVRVVKAFASQALEIDKFRGRNGEQRDLNLKRAKVEAWSFPAMDLMVGLIFVLLAWYGGLRVMNGETTLGTFFAYQWYLWGIIWPVRFGGWIISMMREAMGAAPRLFELLDRDPQIADRPDARPLPRVTGKIEFRNVSFAFPDDPSRNVLDGFNLTIMPGEVVAILGETGTGKSSIFNLMLRFYDVTEGAILIDGHDLREVTLESLRRQMAIVPQESFLFSATVADNIAYGHPEATREQIVAAAKLAHAHEFIVALDQGYESIVGERGIGLSGGQKQRMALARALLTEPRILLLDEATSAVDTETEHNIQIALEEVMAHRTSLIIAQRLSTIKHADRVVVIEAGRVAESGTHDSLMAHDGAYARLYALQYREQDEAEQEALAAIGREHYDDVDEQLTDPHLELAGR